MNKLSTFWTPRLVGLACGQFALDPKGDHGLPHWTRVAHHAIDLANELHLDPTVPALFALFHDTCRESEQSDPAHGQRAGAWVLQLARRGHFSHLSHEQLDLLSYACSQHSEGLTWGHPVVQVCWDADRLDLGRVGIEPNAKYLCTEQAQDPQRIRNAYRWAQGYARAGHMAPSLKKKWSMGR